MDIGLLHWLTILECIGNTIARSQRVHYGLDEYQHVYPHYEKYAGSGYWFGIQLFYIFLL